MTISTRHHVPPIPNGPPLVDLAPRPSRHRALKRVVLGALLLLPVPVLVELAQAVVRHAAAPAGGGG